MLSEFILPQGNGMLQTAVASACRPSHQTPQPISFFEFQPPNVTHFASDSFGIQCAHLRLAALGDSSPFPVE